MPRVRKGDVVWVEPELVCEVEFAEWTHDGRLRAPSYQGLREDKRRREVRQRGAAARPRSAGASACSSSRTSTRPSGPTRGSRRATCSRYYRDVAPVLVPHLQDRPFTMKRYPDGSQGKLLLPEGRAEAHAGLDPDARAFRSSTRDSAAAAPRRSRRRS